MTLGAGQVRELLDRHGVRLRQSLGQNFVVDPNTVERIVRLADVGPGDRVVEVGAGCGSLTVALSDAGAKVTAIEIDRRLAPVLAEVLEGRGVEVVTADATELDWAALTGDAPATLVANLPYNVGTGIVLDVLVSAPSIRRLVVMIQREVAERFVAPPGDERRGIPSVVVEYFADAEIVARVPPTVFFPRPRVDSAVLRLERRGVAPVAVAWESMEPFVRAAFGQRRKMLRRSLASLVAAGTFERSGVSPSARPAELSIAEWGRLASAREATPSP